MATTIAKPVAAGEHATFGVTTDLIGAYKYQWKRDGIPVGGNNKSYTTPPLRPEDFKAKYSVTVTGQDKIEESDVVVLADVVAKPAPAKPVTPPAVMEKVERRHGAPDTRPQPRAERRVGAPDNRPLVAVK